MSKKLMLLVGGILVVGGILAAVMITNNNDSTSNNNQSSQENAQSKPTETSSEPETAVEGNLKTLATSGKPQVCDMSYSGEDGEGTGKLYTNGNGKGRIQLELTTARGNKGESNTLLSDGKVYSWTKTDGGAFGFVMSADSVQTNSTGSPTTSNSQTAGKNFNMKCKTWTVEETIITVPADVNFSALPSAS